MKLIQIFFLSLFCCLWPANRGRAQQALLSAEARISVITCGPGTDLYATFGHSAFRVWDPAQGIDWVYNYGTFDFNTPNFYLKFARGKLLYALSRQDFPNFLYTYQLEQRWVREQMLDLSPAEQEELFAFLEQNNRPENRYYHYDFLFENCATKIPEVLRKVLGGPLVFEPGHLTETHSFRELIQQNLDRNSWSSLGIDLALGAVIDRDARPEEYMFLPQYVRLQMEDSRLGSAPLVQGERVILDLPEPRPESYFTTAPLFWLLLLLAFTMALTAIDFRHGRRSRWLDTFLFAGTGLAGLFMLFLWFLTDHTSTAWNANLLWAFPANAVMAVYLLRKPGHRFLTAYLKLALVLLGVCPLLWAFGIQEFSPVLVVLWLALSLRYAYLIRYLKPQP